MMFVAWLIWIGTMATAAPFEIDRWQVVNDSVMGGISTSEVVEKRAGAVSFRGELSLENNGGFTSARYYVTERLRGMSGQRCVGSLRAPLGNLR